MLNPFISTAVVAAADVEPPSPPTPSPPPPLPPPSTSTSLPVPPFDSPPIDQTLAFIGTKTKSLASTNNDFSRYALEFKQKALGPLSQTRQRKRQPWPSSFSPCRLLPERENRSPWTANGQLHGGISRCSLEHSPPIIGQLESLCEEYGQPIL
ncbi:hypothetical protein STAS_04277 [Striga asiatica]|uniref:Uncharacterized protein n=1 Tax=Striga asiatica TaxID=4170 RepID=A0A5A7P7G2_STRAF|nr:hypothetical protein STAS_04277 [Striga asiatica]